MSEIKTNEVLDILDKLQFFQGQRVGRELWLDKPPVVQEQDLYNFNCDIEKIRSYIQTKNNMMQEIVERLEDLKQHNLNEAKKCSEFENFQVYMNDNRGFYRDNAKCYEVAIEVVKEVGGLDG